MLHLQIASWLLWLWHLSPLQHDVRLSPGRLEGYAELLRYRPPGHAMEEQVQWGLCCAALATRLRSISEGVEY